MSVYYRLDYCIGSCDRVRSYFNDYSAVAKFISSLDRQHGPILKYILYRVEENPDNTVFTVYDYFRVNPRINKDWRI